MKRKLTYNKKASLFLAIVLLWDSIWPSLALGLTSGPASPEFTSYEPVATTSMVNEFTGDFTYNLPVLNIPGPNGGGYALSLSYHSGEAMESEASWVGYGWTLNPGAINRNKRGFPDDARGKEVRYWNKTKTNITGALGVSLGLEIFKNDITKFNMGVTGSISYNTYKGFGMSAGSNLSWSHSKLPFDVSLGFDNADGTYKPMFNVDVNPGFFANLEATRKKNSDIKKTSKIAKENLNAVMKTIGKEYMKRLGLTSATAPKTVFDFASSYGMHFFSAGVMPTNVAEYTGTNIYIGLQGLPTLSALPIGGELGVWGSYSYQESPHDGRTRNIYGYLYSKDALADEDGLMDYYSEKESHYNKRDNYLSIPFTNNDIYSLTGEGLSGGFKLHSKKTGHFRPGATTSSTDLSGSHCNLSFNGGFNLGMGATLNSNIAPNLGMGAELTDPPAGEQQLKLSGSWRKAGNESNFKFDNGDDEAYFFRFIGDPGGSVQRSNNAKALNAGFTSAGSIVPGLKDYKLDIPSSLDEEINSYDDGVSRVGRSSYIGYNTMEDLVSGITIAGTWHYPRQYDKTSNLRDNVNLLDGTIKDNIAELCVYNETGNQYVYGLPVFARNETSFAYDTKGLSGSFVNNFLAAATLTNCNTKVGEDHNYAYVTSYLLTQITTPDYIDRNLNGPDEADFGGWTKFGYRRKYGSGKKEGTDGSWYSWRMPYNGMSYAKNMNYDADDDQLSNLYGEKEMYYLKHIETKSHLAVFVTNNTSFSKAGYTFNGQASISGSGDNRFDCLSSAKDESAATSFTVKGSSQVEKLERIELYAKPTDGSSDYKLLQTTWFAYDYSLCKGAPNNSNTTTPYVAGSNNGKLTLKKVWTEYNGIVNAKISPYEFTYAYPNYTTNPYPAKYSALQSYSVYGSNENPNYHPMNSDAWGDFEKNGERRKDSLITWLDQTPESTFDPAAWQLKQIRLPSGGQIHIQYEQKDYQFVHDKKACTMVSLLNPSPVSLENKFYLNTNDVGIAPSNSTALTALKDIIESEFSETGRIYFKFLYALANTSSASIGSCNSEYIDGYALLDSAGVDGNGLFIKIKGQHAFSGVYTPTPRQVCLSFVKDVAGGKLDPGKVCDPAESGTDNSFADKASSLLAQLATKFTIMNPITHYTDFCVSLDNAKSYFKIPVLTKKLGGGPRVKRILMYDSGIEPNATALYGTEYSYTLEDGSSSGVASNEPLSIREENALTNVLFKRDEQQWYERILSGRDKENFEGPIGESILPSPSIGYSRVVVSNIHSGKTNPGFMVSEYYTYQDYPYDREYDLANTFRPGFDNTDLETETDFMVLPLGIINIKTQKYWATQGYRFILTDMHGKPKRMSTYSGSSGALNSALLSSEISYTYFSPGEKVTVMNELEDEEEMDLGMEEEISMETRQVEDITNDVFIEFSGNVGFFGFVPIPFILPIPNVNYSYQSISQHVISKVLHYPALLKSTTEKRDGTVRIMQNLAFDKYTGEPLKTRTFDGYHGFDLEQSADHNGAYTSYSFPARTKYDEMGPKFINEDYSKTYTSSYPTYNNYVITLPDPCEANYFCKGDLITFSVVGGPRFYSNITNINTSKVPVTFTVAPNAGYSSAINTYTSTSGNVNLISVIRSGRSNQLKAIAGKFTTYGSDNSCLLGIESLLKTQLQNLAAAINNTLTSNTPPTISTYNYFDVPLNTSGACIPSDGLIKVEYDYGTETFTVSVPSIDNCGKLILEAPATVTVDLSDGSLDFTGANACGVLNIPCFDVCAKYRVRVVASAVSTFGNGWTYDLAPYDQFSPPSTVSANYYEKGERGKWRPVSGFIYRTTITGGSKEGTTERNYNDAGVYMMDWFNWKYPDFNDSTMWLKRSTITGYSPHGEAAEERDYLKIYSAGKMGYKSTLPVMVAANASGKSISFDPFENVYVSSGTSYLENGCALGSNVVSSLYSHSGLSSLRIPASGAFSTATLTVNQQIIDKGLVIHAWLMDKDESKDYSLTLYKVGSAYTSALAMEKVAKNGDWVLYKAKVSASALSVSDNIYFKLKNDRASSYLYVDDLKVQPTESKANCYVYDPRTFRVLATFDDQHFGRYYQYNAEGKLVRKLIETERGLKIISEAQYNSPKY